MHLSPLSIRSNYSKTHHSLHDGVSWLYGSHMCITVPYSYVEVFAPQKSNQPLKSRLPQFQYRWAFRYSSFPFPENNPEYPVFSGEGSWIIIPGWLKHTSHLAQNAIFINYHLSHMNDLPPVVVFPASQR